MFDSNIKNLRNENCIKYDILVKLNVVWNPHRAKIQIHKKIYYRNLHKI